MKTRLALIVLAILLAPGTAHAAVTAARDTSERTASLTGDDTGEVITIGLNGNQLVYTVGASPASADWDTTTAGDQNVFATDTPADQYTIIVSTNGGNDVVTITASGIKTLVANLGDGEDLFTGGITGDTVSGGAGDDRIAGGRGGDAMNGGEGSDTLVWNNGDGSDTIDGEGGAFDTVEVNGSNEGDELVVRPGDPGKLRIERINLALFTLTVALTTERAQINGLGGNDKVQTVGSAGVQMSLDGGTGEDNLIGGEVADFIRGGEDNDSLIGGTGDDTLVGDRGDDTMAGGEGSDRMVWNNGDNSDTADGDAGFDVMEVNGAGAGDAFAVRPNGDRTQFDRTNLVPFGINLTAEVLDVNGHGGDDTFTAADGTALLVDADGGSGNDTLTGANGRDVLRGGAGNDTLTGGGGSDAIEGEDGDDTIAARDDQIDAVGCGAGTDKATLDPGDAAADCETAERPPGTPGTPGNPGTVASVVKILTGKVKVAKGRAAIKLECAGTAACAGTLVLSTAKAVKVGRARVVVVLGDAKFSIAAGKTATVSVKLTKSLKVIAGKKKSLKARAVAGTVARNVTLTRGKRW